MASSFNIVNCEQFKGTFYIPKILNVTHSTTHCFREILESKSIVEQFLETFISATSSELKEKFDNIISFTGARPKNDLVVLGDLGHLIAQLPKIPYYESDADIIANRMPAKLANIKDPVVYYVCDDTQTTAATTAETKYNTVVFVRTISDYVDATQILREYANKIHEGKIIIWDHDTTLNVSEVDKEDLSSHMSNFINILYMFYQNKMNLPYKTKYWRRYEQIAYYFTMLNETDNAHVYTIVSPPPKPDHKNISRLFCMCVDVTAKTTSTSATAATAI